MQPDELVLERVRALERATRECHDCTSLVAGCDAHPDTPAVRVQGRQQADQQQPGAQQQPWHLGS
ncbi:MAG: hypothetical protein ACJA2F_000505, partial [Nitriliruptoraceae bacterium]